MTKLSRSRSTRAHETPLARVLLAWYDRHRRDLPWRSDPSPYAVWVSEVMLQQTQAATVIPYFRRWMERFPTVSALARAEDDQVLEAFQGLGYYSRARRLLSGARVVARDHGGELPRTVAELRALPGIGPYSAGAIASIAFGLREPLVDGNVVRVLCRVFGLRGDPDRAPLKTELWALARSLLPETRAGDFNQALMELGATVCLPRSPTCHACPVAVRCKARLEKSVDRLPELKKRAPATKLSYVAAVVERSGKLLMVRVPETAPRWAGMWQFPNVELAPGETPGRGVARAARSSSVEVRVEERLVRIEHAVTRYRITLDAYHCRLSDSTALSRKPRPQANAAWLSRRALTEKALPSAHRRILDALHERPRTQRGRP